jgi:putative transposase
LGHSGFVNVLKYEGNKNSCVVVEIPRFYPSSKECSVCGFINDDLTLRDREWDCPSCNTHHDRDNNAANNICRVGASTLGVEIVRPIVI